MRFHNVIHLKKTDKEEMKLVRETQKILETKRLQSLQQQFVPIVESHEAVNVEFKNEFEVSDIQNLLHHTDGVVVQDNNDTYTYPMPMYAQGKDDVFVGRIRRDENNQIR
jgi:aspartate-semialdehyde dehydrogenase